MPLYDYRCPECRQAWESLQDRWDSPSPACPACGSERSERQLSTFAVVASSAVAGRSVPGGCGTGDCACRRAQDQS